MPRAPAAQRNCRQPGPVSQVAPCGTGRQQAQPRPRAPRRIRLSAVKMAAAGLLAGRATARLLAGSAMKVEGSHCVHGHASPQDLGAGRVSFSGPGLGSDSALLTGCRCPCLCSSAPARPQRPPGKLHKDTPERRGPGPQGFVEASCDSSVTQRRPSRLTPLLQGPPTPTEA